MTAYALVLLAISIALLPKGSTDLRNKTAVWRLGLMALCYAGLIALSLNVEHTVELGDRYPGRNIAGWLDHSWPYAALLDVGAIAVLHIVLAVVHQHNKPAH